MPLLIYMKKYLHKRNPTCKFNLSLERTNLFKTFTTIITNNSVLSLLLSQGIQRLHWTMEYEQSWFEKMWKNCQNEIYSELWQKDFWMPLLAFEYKIYLLAQNISVAGTDFWRGIPIGKRVGVGLRRLSTGNSFRTISKVFRTGNSTLIKLVNKLFSELARMSPKFIKFPKTNLETEAEMRSFSDFTVCKIP